MEIINSVFKAGKKFTSPQQLRAKQTKKGRSIEEDREWVQIEEWIKQRGVECKSVKGGREERDIKQKGVARATFTAGCKVQTY